MELVRQDFRTFFGHFSVFVQIRRLVLRNTSLFSRRLLLFVDSRRIFLRRFRPESDEPEMGSGCLELQLGQRQPLPMFLAGMQRSVQLLNCW